MQNEQIILEAVRRSLATNMLSPGRPLNPAQIEALQSYELFLLGYQPGGSRAFVDMATGSGKTGLFAVISRHAFQVAHERGLDQFKIVIVEPTLLLLSQTRDELVSIAPELQSDIGLFGGRQRSLDKPLSIMTYEAWSSLVKTGQLRMNEVGFQVSDEAHHGLSDNRQTIMKTQTSETVHFGVTATSAYDADKTLEQTHQNLIYKLSLREAIERGLLADYVHVQYGIVRLLPQCREASQGELNKADYTLLRRQEWARLVEHAYAYEMDGITGLPLSDKIGAVFAADTRHADSIAQRLNTNVDLSSKAKALGFKAVAVSIHSVGHSAATQQQFLDEFKSGQYMVAVGDRKFKAGFDYDRLKFIASYPGASLVDCVQEMGRATRRYIDPISQVSQGAVIFEAIPYVGSLNPARDQQARRDALRKNVAAFDVLGDTVVLAPGRAVNRSEEPQLARRAPVSLSSISTAELYITHQETITVRDQMKDAQAEEQRIYIGQDTLSALNARVFERGGFGGVQLIKEVGAFEHLHNLEPTGLTHGIIKTLMGGLIKTVNRDQWIRLNDVLDTLPITEARRIPGERVALSKEMSFALRQAIDARFSGVRKVADLLETISAFESERGLASLQIKDSTIHDLCGGRMKSANATQWNRLHVVLNSTPLLEGKILSNERVAITEDMLGQLQAKLGETGKYGSRRLFRVLEGFEARFALPSIELTESTIRNTISGEYKSIKRVHWDRLNAVVNSLPKQAATEPEEQIALSIKQQKMLRKRIANAGDYGASRIMQSVQDYEKRYGLERSGITKEAISRILYTKSGNVKVPPIYWERLNQIVGHLPTLGPRIKITAEMLKEISSKTAGYSWVKIEEHARRLAGQNEFTLSDNLVRRVLSGRTKTIHEKSWKELSAVADQMARNEVVHVQLTPEIGAELDNKLTLEGNRPRRLLYTIQKFESLRGLVPSAVTEGEIEALLSGRLTTIDTDKLSRVREVVDYLALRDACKPSGRHLGSRSQSIEHQRLEAIIHEKVATSVRGVADALVAQITQAVIASLAGTDIKALAPRPSSSPRGKSKSNLSRIAKKLEHASIVETSEIAAPTDQERHHRLVLDRADESNPLETLRAKRNVISGSVFRTLGISDIDALAISAPAEIISSIAHYLASWAAEPPAEKQRRNKLIERSYQAERDFIVSSVAQGHSAQAISDDLNSRESAEVEWTPALLLRGAVLTMSEMPIAAFLQPHRPGASVNVEYKAARYTKRI